MRGLDLPERTEDFTADPVELFFDLAYVFAFSQIVSLLLHDPTWNGVGKAAIVFLLLWLPWSQFTWSANAVSGNSRLVRILFLVATTASIPMAASITTAFEQSGPLLSVPLVIIFLTALAMMVSGLETGSDEYRSSLRYSIPNLLAMATIGVGGFLDGDARVIAWLTGIAIFLFATIRAGRGPWIIRTGHFAERHGLIIIVALGEVIVALGNSIVDPLAGDEGFGAGAIVTLVSAGVFAGLLWWAYFDRVQPSFEHRAEQFEGGAALGRFVRDVYTYAHAPIVAGIVLTAVALEEATLHPSPPLPAAFRAMGAVGLTMYFGGISAGVHRSYGVIAWERLGAVVAIIIAMSAASDLSGGALLVVLDGILLVALTVEYLRIERPGHEPSDTAGTESPTSSVDDGGIGHDVA